MVASTWNWDGGYMLSTFGWKAAVAVVVNASVAAFVLRKHLTATGDPATARSAPPVRVPLPAVMVHLVLRALAAGRQRIPRLAQGRRAAGVEASQPGRAGAHRHAHPGGRAAVPAAR